MARLTFNEQLRIVKWLLTLLTDNRHMELILLALVPGSLCFALLIACIRVVSSDPGEEQAAEPQN